MGDQENFSEPASVNGILGNKRILILTGIILVAVILLVGFFTVSRNSSKSRKSYKYVTVFERLEPEEASKIREELSYAGLHFKTLTNGKFRDIEIRSDEADEARIKMAQKGLPQGGVIGFEIFDKSSSLGVTDFDKRIKFIRAINGELSRNISRINSISNARVQIVVPEDKPFSIRKPKVTASVLVQKKPDAEILPEQVRAIMHLVAASVESLEPDNVTVIDMDGSILSEQITEITNSKIEQEMVLEAIPSSDSYVNLLEAKNKMEEELSHKVTEVLSKLYPDGSTYVMATIEFDDSISLKIPLIKKKNILILLDKNHNIELTRTLKNTTFTSIAAVTGYKKGRDRIELRWAKHAKDIAHIEGVSMQIGGRQVTKELKTNDVPLNNQLTSTTQTSSSVAETERVQRSDKLKRNAFDGGRVETVDPLINQQYKYFNIKIVAAVILIIVSIIIVGIVRRKRSDNNSYSEDDFDTSIFNSKLEQDPDETDIQEEQVDQIQQMVENDPDAVANLIQKWFTESEQTTEIMNK